MWWINCFPNTLKAEIQTFFHSIAKLTAINLSDPIIHLKHSTLIKSAHLPACKCGRGRGGVRGGGSPGLFPLLKTAMVLETSPLNLTWKMRVAKYFNQRMKNMWMHVPEPPCHISSSLLGPDRQKRHIWMFDAVWKDHILLLVRVGFLIFVLFCFVFFSLLMFSKPLNKVRCVNSLINNVKMELTACGYLWSTIACQPTLPPYKSRPAVFLLFRAQSAN